VENIGIQKNLNNLISLTFQGVVSSGIAYCVEELVMNPRGLVFAQI